MMDQRTAVVSGGNRGIGKEICGQLARHGIKVILTSRNVEAGQVVTTEFQARGMDIVYLQLDVADRKSVDHFVQVIDQEAGRVDILVNNAGIYLDRDISPLEVGLDIVRQTMETNVYGPLYLSQKLFPLMRRNRYGRIVNISSQMGSLAEMGGRALAYRISKTSLNAVTRILAAEVQGENILVNAVDPGWVRSDMGGQGATRSLAEGADTAFWLATLQDGGPSGGFFRDRKPRPW